MRSYTVPGAVPNQLVRAVVGGRRGNSGEEVLQRPEVPRRHAVDDPRRRQGRRRRSTGTTTATPKIRASPGRQLRRRARLEPGGPTTTLTGFNDWAALRLNQVGSRRNFARILDWPAGRGVPGRRVGAAGRRVADSRPTGRGCSPMDRSSSPTARCSWAMARSFWLMASEFLADGSTCSPMARGCSRRIGVPGRRGGAARRRRTLLSDGSGCSPTARCSWAMESSSWPTEPCSSATA